MTFHQQEISFWIENIILIFRTIPEPDSEKDSLKQNPGSCAVRTFEESKHLQTPSKQNDVQGSRKETNLHEAIGGHETLREVNCRDLHIENLNQSPLRDKSETQKDNFELMVPSQSSYLKSPAENQCLVSHQQRILQDSPVQNNFLDPHPQKRLEGSSKENHNQKILEPRENHPHDSPQQENHFKSSAAENQVQDPMRENHYNHVQHSPTINHYHGSPTQNHRSSPFHIDKSVQCDFMPIEAGRDGGCQSKTMRLETEDKLEDIIASLALRKMHQLIISNSEIIGIS
jgi:hypothetical protein